jgi:type IV pilus assembly protein PilQ
MELGRVIDVHRLHYYRIYQCLLLLISSLYSQNREIVPSGELLQEEPFGQLVVNMDFKDTAMKDIIRLLATRYGLNIFIDDRVTVRLTLHLVNVSVRDALIFMVEDNGLILEKIGSIYKISQAPPAPELPAPPHPWKISYQDGLLSVDFTGEDIREALLQISRITGHTILLDRSVSGEITGLIQALPFQEAMHQLLRNAGFIFKKEGDVYQVRRLVHEAASGNNSPNFWISTHQELIDIEISDASLNRVVSEISRQLNVNMVSYGDLTGKITAQAHNLTLEQCLHLILSGNDYTFKKSGDAYLIGDRTNKMLVSSHLIKLNHLKVDGIVEMLPQKILEKAEFKVVREHNALLINGPGDILSEVRDIVDELDRPIPQILLEALVVDFNYQDIRDISLEAGLSDPNSDSTWGRGDKWFPDVDIYWTSENANKYLGKLTNFFGVTQIGKLPPDFYLQVKALETVGKANIRSRPQIATLNGHTADITIGQTQYYILKTQTPIRDPSQIYIQESQQFETIEANITLKITPWVSASGEITAEIHPEFNHPVGQFSSTVPPTIQRRALNSTVRMQDGETIVLGGLIQTAEIATINKIPFLGSLPLIGRFFQNRNHNKSKSELIIYITPHLSYGDELLSGNH